MKEVTVIIVNWNGRDWLEKLLPSLEAQTYPEFETIIVDNGSVDGSVNWLHKQYPQIRLIVLETNVGFAIANNMAIRASETPFVLALNNDTQVSADFIAQMQAGMDDPQVGMVAAKVVQWRSPDKLDSAGIDVNMLGMAYQRGWGELVDTFDESADIFGPSGAAALYRRRMLDEIGLFDEAFFAYYEDVDLAWRAQRAGWRCYYQPTAVVQHWHSATSGNIPQFKMRLLSRNKWLTIANNIETMQLARYGAAIVVSDMAATFIRMVQTRSFVPLTSRAIAWRMWRERRTVRTTSKRLVPLASLFATNRDLA